ncbi:hypothetical protein COLO4_19315 [Corchorus olitorius]|uniref:Uncharacterized protein n=1 Tax=Corchorus olitorius TaxID=93759 RepID=A0A1R3J5P8_9ROSI|nr:hypothetical protein COLO4_19315 [Corchorus olitorius]
MAKQRTKTLSIHHVYDYFAATFDAFVLHFNLK